jgi:hypothetical protein
VIRARPFAAFLFALLLVLAASFVSLAPYAILALTLASALWVGRAIFRPSTPGFAAVTQLIVILALAALAFAEVYILLPPDSFEPRLARTWAGIADAIYYSVLTMATLGSADRRAVTWDAKVVELCQILVSVVVVGYGINYLLEERRKR